jgi:hypothetical protein
MVATTGLNRHMLWNKAELAAQNFLSLDYFKDVEVT